MKQGQPKKYGKNPNAKHSDKINFGTPLKDTYTDELKPIFAAYLNIARQNMYDTLCHISDMIGITETATESNIANLQVVTKLAGKKEVEIRDFIMRQLLSQFPMLKVMVEEERTTQDNSSKGKNLTFLSERAGNLQMTVTADKVDKIIRNIAKVLTFMRDKHTHYFLQGDKNDIGGAEHDKYLKAEREVGKYIETTFIAATQAAKERFSTADKEVDTSVLIKAKYKGSDGKYNSYFAMTKSVKGNIEENGRMTPMALIFLICLLINKHQASMFLDKLGKSFYGEVFQPPKFEQIRCLMREVFSFYRIRLAKDRIHSERSEHALALDMLNEVNKCPRELFSHLRANEQEQFRIVTEATQNDANNASGEALLIRKDDRFPYFALRYIDDMRIFHAMRFHVNYGKYRYVFKEDKKCADGEIQPRILQYELNGFGRLNEIEKKRLSIDANHTWDGTKLIRIPREQTEEEKELSRKKAEAAHKGNANALSTITYDKDDAATKPYITDCTTHYIMNNNHIGINFDLTSKSGDIRGDGSNMPSITQYVVKKADSDKVVKSDNKPANEGIGNRDRRQPICRMSIFELPAMIFHQLLYADTTVENGGQTAMPTITKTEDVIRQCVYNYQRLFKDIFAGTLQRNSSFEEIEKEYHLCKKDIPEKLCDYIKGIDPAKTKFSKEVLKKHGLTGEDIPRKLKSYTGSLLSPFQVYAITSLAKMLKQTNSKIRIFDETWTAIVQSGIGETRENSVGRKSFKEFKAGELANFLSRDIVQFQKTVNEGKDRPTGLNYRKMQASIAQYGGASGYSLEDFKTLFTNLGLIGKDSRIKHPFLAQVLNKRPRNTVEFYRYYLNERKAYLENIEFNQLQSLPFLHANQSRWQIRDAAYYKRLAQSYYKNTIDLPTGLFTAPIKARLLELYPEQFKTTDDFDFDKCNVAGLIARYHQLVSQDASQNMYGYARNYKIYDLLNSESQPAFSKKKDVKFDELKAQISHIQDTIEQSRCRKYFNEFNDSERTLRRYQVQDILSFMMAKDILSRQNTKENQDTNTERGTQSGLQQNFETFKLRDVRPKYSKSILEAAVPFEMTLTFKNGRKITVTQDDLKMKNYGDFFMVLSDSRIYSIIPYIDGVDLKVSREKLEAELDMYDRNRVKVFSQIQGIEKNILTKSKKLRTATFESDNEQSFVSNNFRTLLTKYGLNENAREILIDIRNAFCHNHYTDKNRVSVNPVQLGIIAKRITDMIKPNTPR
jgi:hypothetical protein